ncbi:MAG: hypothetical protein RMJ15_07875 [Nitrososphaerota archaeon]|nr:hypothetical protein [Candidatus Bathyarchaeota archaeon]MDW8023635.1 hypothetical protein [Nitrososphaerota archaeon]
MNEEDVKLVRQIARETVFEVLDTEVWDAIFELVDGIEAGIAALKHSLGIKKGVKAELLWNPDKIKWEKVEGRSGPYERSEDVDNPEFKGMMKDLARHKGKLTREGYFYWTFKNGSTVGRKKRG